MQDFTSIPFLDMSYYHTDKSRVAEELVDICKNIGFFYIKNHDINTDLIKKIFILTNDFFGLSAEEKEKLNINKNKYHRGYTSSKGTSKEANECLRLGIDLPEDHHFVKCNKPLCGPNPKLHKISGFNKTINEYINSLNCLAIKVLDLLSIGLKLEENFFSKHVDTPLSTLLLLKYPKMNILKDDIQGCRPHTDFHCLTILLQDDVGGLQVKNKKGVWIDASPVENTFVVNIGDLLAYWSGCLFKATPHRVLRITNKERISIPYFFNVDFDTKIHPLELNQKGFLESEFKIVGDHVLNRVNSVYINHEESF